MGDAMLLRLFGTTRPTRAMIKANHDFWDELNRGQGVYILLYQDERPVEIFFAGYSFD